MSITNIPDYFIPVEIRNSKGEEYYKSRTLVVVSLSVGCIIFLFLANRIWLNGLVSVYSISLGCTAIAVFTIPFIQKMSRSITIGVKTLILILASLIMVLTYTTGGPFSPSLAFIPIFPLGGILFVGHRFGALLALLFTGHLALLVWANQTGNLPTRELEDSIVAGLHIACTIAVAIVLAVIGLSHVLWQKGMREKLQAASQAKSEFLSGMSHELRTPLNAIVGFSELLHRGMAGPLTEKQTDFAGNILSSSSHMLSLVNDLLDIAKIEAGEMALNLEPVAVKSLIAASVEMVSDTATKKHLRILNEMDESIADKIAYLDPVKFKQILLNLLSNAIKFTPDGSTIRLTSGISDNSLSIIVADEGAGISPEHSELVFEKFYQVHCSGYGNTTGTGLGLPISRFFAELHNGTLKLFPNPYGNGACFLLTMPIKNENALPGDPRV